MRGILDHRDVARVVDFGERVIIGTLAEQVDRDDRAGPVGNRSANRRGIDIEAHRIDIDQNRRRAKQRDHFGGGDIAERRRDHLVAAPDAERHQRQLQRVRTVRDANAMPDTRTRGERGFELGHFGTENILPVREHRGYPCVK